MILQSFFPHQLCDLLRLRLSRIAGRALDRDIFNPVNGVHEVVVAIDRGDAGFVILTNDDDLHITSLWVREKDRVKGIGRALVQHLLDNYEGKFSVISMKSTTPFWEKMGFSITNDTDEDVGIMTYNS